MIKFLTALVDVDGVIVGAQIGDMPMPADFSLSGATPVSVGSVVTHGNSPHDLVNKLRYLLAITTDAAGRHTVTLDTVAAKAHVTSVFHHESTMQELETATAINPLVANWLSMRLHADHEIKDRMDAEAAKSPHLAAVVKDMLHKRFTPYELTPMQRLARKERRLAEAKLKNPI